MQSKSSVWEALLWMVAYVAVVGFGTYLVNAISPEEEAMGAVSVLIVGATGLVIIWYTVETKRLRVEAQRQTEVSQRPFVVGELVPKRSLHPIPNNSGGVRQISERIYELEVKNVGNGTALTVCVDAVCVREEPRITVRFSGSILVLVTNTTATLPLHSFRDGKPSSPIDYFSGHLDPRFANQQLSLTIRFENVEKQSYFVQETVIPGATETHEPGKLKITDYGRS